MAIDSKDKRFSFMRFGDRLRDFPLLSGGAGFQTDQREQGAGIYAGLNYSPPVQIESIGNENRSFKIGISIGF